MIHMTIGGRRVERSSPLTTELQIRQQTSHAGGGILNLPTPILVISSGTLGSG
jgi:hypothetical protein